MKLGITLAAVLAVAVSAPALAKDDGDKAPVKEKKICRTEKVTGSLVAKRRICMTKAEWDKLAMETKKDLEDIQRNGNAIPRTAGGNGSTAGFQ
jgi:predicted secreted protein